MVAVQRLRATDDEALPEREGLVTRSIRDLPSVQLYDAVARREITAEQAADETERREIVAHGLATVWAHAILACITLVIAVVALAISFSVAGLLLLVTPAIFAEDAVRRWRAWRRATRPEATP